MTFINSKSLSFGLIFRILERKKIFPDLKFLLEAFSRLDLPNLSINIWEYNDEKHKNSSICKQYEKWCIEAGECKWKDIYMDFDYIIENMKKKNIKNSSIFVNFLQLIEKTFVD